MTAFDDPSPPRPTVLEVVPHDQAEASIRATRETLEALQSRVDELAMTVERLEDRLRELGLSDDALAEANERLDAAITQLGAEAAAYEERVVAAARVDATAIVTEAESRTAERAMARPQSPGGLRIVALSDAEPNARPRRINGTPEEAGDHPRAAPGGAFAEPDDR